MDGGWTSALITIWIATLLGGSGPIGRQPEPATDITIFARQYGYEPHRIVVDAGEVVRFRLVSRDTVHGWYLEGHDVDARVFPGRLSFDVRRPSEGDTFETVDEVVIRFDRPGRYHYRCSVTCGTLHPFMQGELVVRPNFPVAAGAAGVLLIGLGVVAWMVQPARAAPRPTRRLDLLAVLPRLRWLVTRRWFPFVIVFPALLVLAFFIAAGLFGSPVGNRNITVTTIWILWWFALIVVLVPIGGRVWCLACPVPFLGEWLSRRRLIGVARGTKRRRWPRRLQNLWTQNVLFVAICSVSTMLITRPVVTAVVLAALVLGAVVVHLIFERRTFCRYVCPLNGWMGLYAMASATEVRAVDPHVCGACRTRACVTGTDRAWPCPWLLSPFRLDRNTDCGVCLECVKACPDGNVTLRLRPFCSDRTVRGLDEAWIACIMIALAIAYSVTLLGPWPSVRDWANVTESGAWGGFAVHTAAVWSGAFVLVPALWLLASWLSTARANGGRVGTREVFVRSSFMLVPLGLMAWIGFSLPLMLLNHTHVTASFSDPLGTGWNLFGTAAGRWRPLLPAAIPYMQIPVLLAGLAAALWSGGHVMRELYGPGRDAVRALLPHAAACMAITLVLLRLYAG